jgi:hypothetical protein
MFSIIKQNGQESYGLTEFIIDFQSDVSDLPTDKIAAGSTAICVEDSSIYILDNYKKWRKL